MQNRKLSDTDRLTIHSILCSDDDNYSKFQTPSFSPGRVKGVDRHPFPPDAAGVRNPYYASKEEHTRRSMGSWNEADTYPRDPNPLQLNFENSLHSRGEYISQNSPKRKRSGRNSTSYSSATQQTGFVGDHVIQPVEFVDPYPGLATRVNAGKSILGHTVVLNTESQPSSRQSSSVNPTPSESQIQTESTLNSNDKSLKEEKRYGPEPRLNTRRAQQNRESQRAFRQRRELEIKELRKTASKYTKMQKYLKKLLLDYKKLERAYQEARKELDSKKKGRNGFKLRPIDELECPSTPELPMFDSEPSEDDNQ